MVLQNQGAIGNERIGCIIKCLIVIRDYEKVFYVRIKIMIISRKIRIVLDRCKWLVINIYENVKKSRITFWWVSELMKIYENVKKSRITFWWVFELMKIYENVKKSRITFWWVSELMKENIWKCEK